MSNYVINAFYLPTAVVLLCLTIFAWKMRRKKRMMPNLIFLNSMILGWLGINILYFLTPDFTMSAFLHDLSLPFVAMTSLALLLFVIRAYGFDGYHAPTIIIVLSIIPVYTLGLVLTYDRHNFIRDGLEILSTVPYHRAYAPQGFWFWVHTGYCYVLIAVSFLIVAIQYRNVPRIYRASSNILLVGMLTGIIGNILVVFQVFPLPIDFSLMGTSICAIILYYFTTRKQELHFLNSARINIFHRLESGIFILDDNGQVINRNNTAKKGLTAAGLDPEVASFQIIRERLYQAAYQSEQDEEQENSTNFYFSQDDQVLVLHMKERSILDNKGREIGSIVICRDVSEAYMAVRRLETEVGMDAITGILNGRSMAQVKTELDTPANLPLTVIAGDLNNLKMVNDTMGHQQGDALLREAADALLTCCPPNARVGRIGGDEFLVLIPAFSQAQAVDLIGEIRYYLEQSKNEAFHVSIALGLSVKTSAEQDLEQIIRNADQEMYQNKKNYRSRQHN